MRALPSATIPGDSAAHWMAILAMDQHAQLLAAFVPGPPPRRHPRRIAATVERGRLAILAPYAWLRSEDPTPHGWHVTSDSIAAWVAARLAARRLALLKSVEGARDDGGAILAAARRGRARGKVIVDEYFPQALEPGIEVLDPERPAPGASWASCSGPGERRDPVR